MEAASKKSGREAFPEYEHPPVVERVARLFAQVPEEIYVSRMESWRAMVELEFPVYEPISEWKVTFQQKGTQAVVDPTRGELVIVPRFSKRTAAKGFDWSIRCPKDGLIVNMHSNPREPRRFLDLKTEFAKWLPLWVAHFKVEHLNQIQLHYVNVLNRESVAGFMSPFQTLEADRIIKVFVDIPGVHKSLVFPINC